MLRTIPALSVLFATSCGSVAAQDEPVGRTADGAIVPTHQMLRPMGDQLEFPGRPTDGLLIDGGRTLVIKNRNDLLFVDVGDRVIHQTLALPRHGMSYHGIAGSSDGSRIYVTGSHDTLWIARREEGLARWGEPISLPGPDERDSAPGGMALATDGRLFVALSRNNSIGVVDLERRELVAQHPVGVAPYTVLLHDGILCVSNWGGRRAREGDVTDPSSGTEVVVDPVTNVASTGTVHLLDAADGSILAEIEVGLHPCAMVVDAPRNLLYVANANSDTIAAVDLEGRRLLESFDVRPDARLPFGSSPNALALSADGSRLYVANGTNNAVGLFAPLEGGKPLGFLPVGWYPGGLVLDGDRGRLYVMNTKGLGSLHRPTGRRGYNSHNHLGSLTILSDLSDAALQKGTAVVMETNRHDALEQKLAKPDPSAKPVPLPARHGEPSVFDHVLYVIKENRTYDQVLGDIPRGNGDPELCIFGRKVTPNHHKLVDEFILLDNFYCSGILSADGHAWTNEAFVTDYLEKCFGGFVRSYPYDGDDPLAYAPTGFLWDNALRHGRTFRCYGEMVQASIEPRGTFKEIYDDFVLGTGKFQIRAWSHIDAVSRNMCETFIGFPSIVPDVYRAAQFVKELEDFERKGEMPNLLMMLLPNDHTAGTRPGMPTPEAAVADNDLALGRVVEAVSRSRFWPKTCIFVVQDDPQAGWDHVDGHRTVAMVISPYTRRGGEVVSTRYTQPSMVKSIELILGLPPMNQMDLLANPMTDCFSTEADLTPYEAVANEIPLDRLNASLDRLQGPALLDAVASLRLDLDEIDQADEDTFNRILWRAIKGYDASYPVEHTNDGRDRSGR